MLKHISLLCAAAFASLTMASAQGEEQYAGIPYSFDGFAAGQTLADCGFKTYSGTDAVANEWANKSSVLYVSYTEYSSVSVLQIPHFYLDPSKQYSLSYVISGSGYDDDKDIIQVKVNGAIVRSVSTADYPSEEKVTDIITGNGATEITFEYVTSSEGYYVRLHSISLSEKAQGATVSQFPWSESFDDMDELSWSQYDAVGTGVDCIVEDGLLVISGSDSENKRVIELPAMQLVKDAEYTLSYKVKGDGRANADIVSVEVDGVTIFSETASSLSRGKTKSHTIIGTGSPVIITLVYESDSPYSVSFDNFEIALNEGDPNTLDVHAAPRHKVTKVIDNGRLVIVRDGEKYDQSGRKL